MLKAKKNYITLKWKMHYLLSLSKEEVLLFLMLKCVHNLKEFQLFCSLISWYAFFLFRWKIAFNSSGSSVGEVDELKYFI